MNLPHDASAATAAAQALNTALTAFKNIRELVKSSKDSQLKEQVADFYERLIELRESLMQLQEENAELKKQLRQKAQVQRQGQFGYFFKEGETDPLCPKCYQDQQKLVYLPPRETVFGGVIRRCSVCKEVFWEERKQDEPARVKPYGVWS